MKVDKGADLPVFELLKQLPRDNQANLWILISTNASSQRPPFVSRIGTGPCMKILWTIALLPVAVHATCAIAVWTPTSLILGADGVERVVNPHDAGRESLASVRSSSWEIITCWFPVSRCIEERDSIPGRFCPRRFVKAVRCLRRRTWPLRISNADMRRCSSPRGLTLTRGSSIIWNLTRRCLRSRDLREGVPYLAHCSYDKIRGRWTWTKQLFPREGPAQVSYTYLCEQRGVSMYKGRHPNWRRDNPAKVVQGMINNEEQILPEEVGGPVSLVVIDKNGAHWKNRGVCAARR